MDNKQDQFSDFTLNHYPRDPGDNKPRFLGTMRAPVRDAAGQVTETHFFNVSGWGPNQALNGKDSEYVDIRLQPVHANPVDDARYQQRKSAFDPSKAGNKQLPCAGNPNGVASLRTWLRTAMPARTHGSAPRPNP